MKEAAIIVAHPDDEILWCGGLILQNLHWDWTVLSLCRAGDPDRRPRFKAVCASLDLSGHIADLDDSNPLRPINPMREIGHRIREALPRMTWDLCVTHGRNGEYGHLRHRQVHSEVLRLVGNGVLECRELWTFAYDCDPRTGLCRPCDDADVVLTLTDEQLGRKKGIIREQYGYGEDSFEVRACISPEAFHRHLTS